MGDHIKYMSNEKMFTKSESFEDMYFGKATLYSLQVQQDLIELIINKEL